MIRNNGKIIQIPATDLIVGDILLLKPGDRIPADCLLLDNGHSYESSYLQVDESNLTGDTNPVLKSPCNPQMNGK